MTEIVLGIGASHTTLMNTQWDRVDHLDHAHAFRNALGTAADELAAAKPDVVVVLGSNHFRGFWLDLMPSFSIGVGEVISSGEHGTPKGLLPSDPQFALHVCNSLIGQEFDVAFSTRLTIDHGISHAYQWLMPKVQCPLIPIVINCFAPPLPTLNRTRAFGVALRRAILAFPGAKRVAVIASGGLSHRLPFPDWREPKSDDEEYITMSWREGRGRWQEYETRRRQIVLGAPQAGSVNEAFDATFLASVREGRIGELPDHMDDATLVRIAGNGAAELRMWQVMAAALDHRPGRVLAYAPLPQWLTGMAVAVIPQQ
jgi:2,3-dihydroxyphenylpropionate 1,2-dioxygenase